MSRNILLVNPNWTGISRQSQRQFRRVWPPLSLALAAAMLRERGFSVRILDANALALPLSRLTEEARGADQVFVTSTPYDRWQCPALDVSFFLDACRAVEPEKLYILGAHVTERPRTLLAATKARAAILSEPEETMLELALADAPASDAPPPPVPGTARLDKDNGLVRAPARPPMEDLDALPLPAFDLLPMGQYHYFPLMGRGFGILEASRGCPFSCSFCYLGMYGKKVRRKSPERFADEVEAMVRAHGLTGLYFMDLEFCLDRDWVFAFCEELERRRVRTPWCCQTRVTDLDPEMARTLRRAGCNLVHLGVESGSERILASTGKGITTDQAARAVKAAREAGLRTALFLNLGFPGETPEEMDQTVDLAVKLSPTWASFHLVVPFPGTRLARDTNTDPEALPPHLYPQYVPSHDLAAVKRKLRRAYARFYLRPSFAANLIRDEARARRRLPWT
ncbi:MAG: B12-binding domain-containing radical SAM protein [Proteobacteria bacterium]|nr:B12-binding domain-containing radical SAM protein [Pseudomonadota bacterium]